MRALVNSPNSPDGIELRDVPEPEPAPNEAAVAVRALSINRGELRLLAMRPDGWRPGQDVSGVVSQAAADGTGPPEGTRVVAWVDQAGWAERTVASTDRIVELPDAVTFEAAATLPVAGITAIRVLRLGGLLLTKRVLITGGSGGVGHFAVQLAAQSKAAVTAVTQSPARVERLRDLGATEVVHDVRDAEGPYDLVLESVGGDSLTASLERLAPDGRLVLFGNSSRDPSTLRFEAFSGSPRAEIHVFRVYESGPYPPFGSDLRQLVSLVGSGRLEPHVGYQGDWSDPASALDALRERRVHGKAVLRIT